MRINMPVTSNEYIMPDHEMLVSKTDVKGVITYCDKEFVAVSGYGEDELLGQPHNLIRHPDMPTQAFEDMWRELKAGKPWTGHVKNRRKNGDFYWVLANVTPISEGGHLMGYMSVRTKPSRDDVVACESAYRLFREGQAKGLAIKAGKVVKEGRLTRLNFWKNWSIRTRLLGLLGFLSVLLVGVGGLGLYGLQTTVAAMDETFEHEVVPIAKLNNATWLAQRNRVIILDAIVNPSPENIQKRVAEYASNQAQVAEIKGSILQSLPEVDKPAAEGLFAAYDELSKGGYDPAIEALRGNNIKEAIRVAKEQISPLNEPVKTYVTYLTGFFTVSAEAAYLEKEKQYEEIRTISITAVSMGVVLALTFGLLLLGGLLRSLRVAGKHSDEIAQGIYGTEIAIEREDEVGAVLQSMRVMQIRQGVEMTVARRRAEESLRIKIALDSVSSNVTVSDKDNALIYMNRAGKRMFETMEPQLRAKFSNFSSGKLIGGKLSEFFEDEALKVAYRAKLDSNRIFDTIMAGRIMRLETNPVYDESGEYLGRVTQWEDRTLEVAVEHEIERIVSSAVKGNLADRIGIEGKEGFFRQVAMGINSLLDTNAAVMDDAGRMLEALAQGDLTESIRNEYEGTFGRLKDNANATAAQLTEIISRIKEAAETINTASKEIATGNTDLSQRTEEQASSLEETASSMEQLTSTVKQNADNARQANQLAAGASDIAVRGGEVVGQVVHTMSSISESSRKIVDIISVIDGIAFQTNILALNAAVEAARAGEQGRGFAVVATEVRNLAQRSAAAAKEIKGLIGDSVDKVKVGTDLVDKAGKTMEEVVTAVKRVTDIMAEISAASTEQSAGIEQVNQAISQMDDVTQQNAALVEQAAAAAESMEEQAQTMNALMATFRLPGGSSARPALSAPRKQLASRASSASPSRSSKALPAKPSGQSDEEWEEF